VSIFVVYPHREHVTAKVRSFVDFLVEQFTCASGGLPWIYPGAARR
jgi:DNA-binding transcriptional LysR family regulator